MIAQYTNGVVIGEYIAGDDGYYMFFPNGNGGGWNETVLFYVLLQIRRLNLEFDTQLRTDPLACGKEVEGVE